MYLPQFLTLKLEESSSLSGLETEPACCPKETKAKKSEEAGAWKTAKKNLNFQR